MRLHPDPELETLELCRLARAVMTPPYLDASDEQLARWADTLLVAGEFDEANEIAREANRRSHTMQGRAA